MRTVVAMSKPDEASLKLYFHSVNVGVYIRTSSSMYALAIPFSRPPLLRLDISLGIERCP